MKPKYAFAFLLLAVFCYSPLHAQTLDELEALWNSHKYQQVLPLLASYWNTQPNGKNWRVGFMIGSCECQTDGLQEYGVAMLEEVLAHLKLPDEARPQAQDYLKDCRQRSASNAAYVSLGLQPVLTQNLPATVVGMTKGGFIPLDRTSLATSTISVTPVPEAELLKRLYPLSETDKALAGALQRLSANASGAVVGHFALVAPFGGSSYSRTTGDCLQKYEPPLEKQFGMAPPTHVVTVYLAIDAHELGDLSRKLHGLQLSLGTVAYSVYSDMSIVGLGGPEGCGSLGHELVHLLIRGNFGNAPAWLEEGLASEVAVTSPRTNTFEFRGSWRDDMLAQEWKLRPTVQELHQMNWTSYTASKPEDLHRVAAVHAMAAVFVRYLASQNQLIPVYFSMRDHSFNEKLTERRTDQEILEKQVGKSLQAIDAAFVQWFGAAMGRNFDAPTSPVRK